MLVGIHEAIYSRQPLMVVAPNALISQYGKGKLQELPRIESVVGFANPTG